MSTLLRLDEHTLYDSVPLRCTWYYWENWDLCASQKYSRTWTQQPKQITFIHNCNSFRICADLWIVSRRCHFFLCDAGVGWIFVAFGFSWHILISTCFAVGVRQTVYGTSVLYTLYKKCQLHFSFFSGRTTISIQEIKEQLNKDGSPRNKIPRLHQAMKPKMYSSLVIGLLCYLCCLSSVVSGRSKRAECGMWSKLENKTLPLQNQGHANCTTNPKCTGFTCKGVYQVSSLTIQSILLLRRTVFVDYHMYGTTE